MMSKRLYVLGNGFDLHHGLKTSYYDFAKFLKKNNSEIYSLLESYVQYPTSDKDLWSRFEENLANLNIKDILEEHSDALPVFSSDAFRDGDRHIFPDIMQQHHQKLTTGLFNEFKEFILNVKYTESAFENKLQLDKSATFLTFNYTNTLERLYNISRNQIIYIHNSAFYDDNDIVLGHGITPERFEEKRPTPPKGLDDEELEQWYSDHDNYEYSYDTGKDEIMKYFKDTYKPTKDIIQNHDSFFRNLISVEEIFVLGHSMSSVDLPYFEQITKSINPKTKWSVSYYNISERDKHLNTLKILNIDRSNISVFELEDFKQANVQLKIDID